MKKKMLAIDFFFFFFPMDFVMIFSYTTQDYWSKISYSRNYIDELYIQASRKDITLKTNSTKPRFEENIEKL